MSTHYLSGVTHLAYAYEMGSQAVTKLAVAGRQGPWQSMTLDSYEARPIHINTNYHSATSEFRIASQTSTGSWYQTDHWHPGQPAPMLNNSQNIAHNGTQFKNPQAIFWRFCFNGNYNLHWVGEPVTSPGSTTKLHHDWSPDSDCEPVSMITKINCSGAGNIQAFVTYNGGFISAELHELGALRTVGKGFAVFANGRDEYRLSWQPGRLLGYWESGFRLQGTEPFEIESSTGAPPAEIAFEADLGR